MIFKTFGMKLSTNLSFESRKSNSPSRSFRRTKIKIFILLLAILNIGEKAINKLKNIAIRVNSLLKQGVLTKT